MAPRCVWQGCDARLRHLVAAAGAALLAVASSHGAPHAFEDTQEA